MGSKWSTEPGSWDRVKEVGGAYGRGLLDSILGIPAAAERALYGPGAYADDQVTDPYGNVRYDDQAFLTELLGFAAAPMAPGAARMALGKSPAGGMGSNFGNVPWDEVVSSIKSKIGDSYVRTPDGVLLHDPAVVAAYLKETGHELYNTPSGVQGMAPSPYQEPLWSAEFDLFKGKPPDDDLIDLELLDFEPDDDWTPYTGPSKPNAPNPAFDSAKFEELKKAAAEVANEPAKPAASANWSWWADDEERKAKMPAPPVISSEYKLELQNLYDDAEKGVATLQQYEAIPHSLIHNASGLDSSLAARQERAAELFPLLEYHGTGAAFPQFRMDAPYADVGVHTGPMEQAHSRIADGYTSTFGPREEILDGMWRGETKFTAPVNIHPLRINPGNVFDHVSDIGQWNNPSLAAKELITNAEARGLDDLAADLRGIREWYNESDMLNDAAGLPTLPSNRKNTLAFDMMRAAMQKHGYDSIRYRNDFEPLFKANSGPEDFASYMKRRASGDDFISYDEPRASVYSHINMRLENLRSQHAMFDPRFKNIASLLAGVAGISAIDIDELSSEIDRIIEENRY